MTNDPAPQTSPQLHYRSCNLCEAMCGLVIAHDGRHVLGIRGDEDDPLSQGHLCPKAFGLRDVYEDPDRLRTPIRRTKQGWEAVSWDSALDETSERLLAIARQHGPNSVAVYQGNPSVHNLGTMLFAPTFVRALGTRNRFSASSVDQLPHHFVSYFLFGHQLLLPVPDVDRSDHLLVLGANPLVSNGSMMSAPGMRRRLAALRQRGGKLIVVDPRRSETAAKADAHHFIQPGRDALLLAALIHRVLSTGGATLGRLGPHVTGLETLRAAVARFSADRVAAAVGIDAATIEAMADAFAAAPTAVCYGRLGVCTAEFGAVGIWLVTALNVITGNFDRAGGMMFASPAIDVLGQTGRGGHDRWRSRVRQLPEFGGELPVAALAEEIDTPGEGQIRALVTSAGNPVLSTPNGRRLEAALGGLSFMVAIDIYRNETTRHANLILPPKTGLEVPHYDLIFHALAVRNTARFADPLFDGDHDGRTDAQIFRALTRRLQKGATTRRRRSPLARAQQAAQQALTPTQQVDLALRRGPVGLWGGRLLQRDGLSVAALRAAPHGVDLGPLQAQIPGRLFTSDQCIQLAPNVLVADLDRLAALLVSTDVVDTPTFDLRLIGRRALADNNSWLHNAPTLMAGRPRCTLHMHPDDASARGLLDGELVGLRSRIGAVQAPLHVTDAMMRGVVSLPHGWGHGRSGTQLQVAAQRPGVSVNDVTDGALLDTLSGNAALSGVPVAVTSAAPLA